MRLGCVLPRPDVLPAPESLTSFVREVEHLGLEHVRLLDHVVNGPPQAYGPGDPYGPDDPFSEPMTSAAFVAGCSSLGVCTGVVIAPQRQTVLLAKQAAEVHRLSAGSLRLGLGLGWSSVEYGALGVPMRGRGERLSEQARLLSELFRGAEVVVEEGAGPVCCRLVPAPSPPPEIWFGCGDAEPALRRVALYGDGWMPSPGLSWERIAQAWSTIKVLAVEAGRDPTAIALDGRVDVPVPERSGVGEAVERWWELGADYLTVKTIDPVGDGFRSASTEPDHHLECVEVCVDIVRGG